MGCICFEPSDVILHPTRRRYQRIVFDHAAGCLGAWQWRPVIDGVNMAPITRAVLVAAVALSASSLPCVSGFAPSALGSPRYADAHSRELTPPRRHLTRRYRTGRAEPPPTHTPRPAPPDAPRHRSPAGTATDRAGMVLTSRLNAPRATAGPLRLGRSGAASRGRVAMAADLDGGVEGMQGAAGTVTAAHRRVVGGSRRWCGTCVGSRRRPSAARVGAAGRRVRASAILIINPQLPERTEHTQRVPSVPRRSLARPLAATNHPICPILPHPCRA